MRICARILYFAFCISRFVFCVLHFAFCILRLHFAFCVLYFAFRILYFAFRVLYFCVLHFNESEKTHRITARRIFVLYYFPNADLHARFVFCILRFAFYILHFAFCVLYFAFRVLHFNESEKNSSDNGAAHFCIILFSKCGFARAFCISRFVF